MSPILECGKHAVIVMQRAALPVVFVQLALAAPALCRSRWPGCDGFLFLTGFEVQWYENLR